MRSTNCNAENPGLVQNGVETAPVAEMIAKTGSNVVHAAFLGDVLAEQNRFGILEHQIV